MTAANPQYLWIVITSGIVCTLLAVSIGANDVANAFSTSVGSGTLTLRGAITIAFIFQVLGSITLGGTVSDSIRTLVLNFSAFADSPYELALGMLCSSVGATAWLMFATFFGIPVSTTHSILGSLAGFGIACGRLNGVRWIQLLYIILSWFIVPILSIVATAALYILLQETILKRENSYTLMKNFHWVFLGLFLIPLSIFIAFENSFLKSATGSLADSYRKWFESNWNKALSVVITLMLLLTIASFVTYTIGHFRMKAGWSFMKSLSSLDPIFVSTKRPVITSEENAENTQNSDQNKESLAALDKENPDLLVTDSKALNSVSNKSEDDFDLRLTMDRSGPMDITIEEDPEGLTQSSKKSFSRSVIEVLLTSVGFPQTPIASRASSALSGISVPYDHDDGEPNGNMHHSGSKLTRFMDNIKSSYSSSSKIPGDTNITSSEMSHGNGSIHQFKNGNGRRKRTKRCRVVHRAKAISSMSALRFLSSEKRKAINDTQTIFSAMQIVGATIAIISQSANDTANAVSTFSTVFFLYLYGIEDTQRSTPWYILLFGGLFISLGLALFGYKVIKTVGLNITRVTPSRGYTIDSTAGSIVLILSHLGIPLSYTHVTVSSIFGIGLIQHVPPCYNPNLKHFKSDSLELDNLDRNASPDNADELPSEQNSNNQLEHNYSDSPSNEVKSDLDNENANADQDLDAMETQKSVCPNFNPFKIRDRFTTQYVNFKLYRKILFTWIITIFCSGAVTGVLFLIAKGIYKAKR